MKCELIDMEHQIKQSNQINKALEDEQAISENLRHEIDCLGNRLLSKDENLCVLGSEVSFFHVLCNELN